MEKKEKIKFDWQECPFAEEYAGNAILCELDGQYCDMQDCSTAKRKQKLIKNCQISIEQLENIKF